MTAFAVAFTGSKDLYTESNSHSRSEHILDVTMTSRPSLTSIALGMEHNRLHADGRYDRTLPPPMPTHVRPTAPDLKERQSEHFLWLQRNMKSVIDCFALLEQRGSRTAARCNLLLRCLSDCAASLGSLGFYSEDSTSSSASSSSFPMSSFEREHSVLPSAPPTDHEYDANAAFTPPYTASPGSVKLVPSMRPVYSRPQSVPLRNSPNAKDSITSGSKDSIATLDSILIAPPDSQSLNMGDVDFLNNLTHGFRTGGLPQTTLQCPSPINPSDLSTTHQSPIPR